MSTLIKSNITSNLSIRALPDCLIKSLVCASSRYSIPTGPTRRPATAHVRSPPAAGHACPVSWAPEAGHGAAVAPRTPSHARRTTAWPGGLLQVRQATESRLKEKQLDKQSASVLDLPNINVWWCFMFQPAEEREWQAAVTSQGRQWLTGAGHGKLLQSGLAEALQGPLNTFSFEERKRPSGSSENSSILGFCSCQGLFFFF